ncbi:MAG: polyphosphate kinase 1 [Crocinitomicaceae bacterium]
MRSILDMELVNRELSWLSFNERVLQEAMDVLVPIIERLRFLGIYSNNMDEFYRVRVANVKRLVGIKNAAVQGYKGSASELLEDIREEVMRQRKMFDKTYLEIVAQLEKEGVYQLTEKNLSEKHKRELSRFFHSELKHEIVPIILNPKNAFPKLQDKHIYLAIRLKKSSTKKVQYAYIQIPSTYSRFYQIKDQDKTYFILVDDIIRLHLDSIFSIFEADELEAFTFKFTRDAELNLDDDLSVSYIDKMEKSLQNRKKGEPVRFVYDRNMPEDLKKYLLKSLNLRDGLNAIPGGRYHNFKDFADFPDFGKKNLIYEKLPPLDHPDLVNAKRYLEVFDKKDILLHFPYQKFDYVVDTLREAAIDPDVKSIKLNVYRLAKNSQIMNALLSAVSNGKEVVVVFELQARFDEENNLYWAERMKEQGAKVIFGVPGLKVHSKLLQITRLVKGKEVITAYVGTGNFNEKTARIYSDIGIFTTNKSICQEIRKVFNLMENNMERSTYRSLLLSPFNSRRKLTALIQNEIDNAKKGLKSGIKIKINNLVDDGMIEKLYQASDAGVPIQMNVRGVCSLVPDKKHSKNIEVISIVDRFLEHARFIIFENNGKPLFYISSADWMERNLDKRIEVGAPVLDELLQNELQTIFGIQWSDNQKSRIFEKRLKNDYRTNELETPVRSQMALYEYYQNLLSIATKH